MAASLPAMAEIEHNRFGASYGQNPDDGSLQIRTTQVLFQKGFNNKRDPDLIPDFELSYALMQSDWGDLERGGFGFGLRHVHNWPLEFRLGANAYYMEKYQLISPDQSDAVDFGGNWQFGVNVGLSVHLSKHIEVGYRFEHMSNGNRYASDPGHISHNVTLMIPFGM